MSWSLKFDETIALIKGKALMAVFAALLAVIDQKKFAAMNRIGRRTVMFMLLIAALVIVWNVLGWR